MKRRKIGRSLIAAALGVIVLLGAIYILRGGRHMPVSRSSGTPALHGNNTAGKETIRYARGFTIEYHQGYKILRVLSPWRDAKATFTYLLVPRGAPVPPIHADNVTVVEIPVRHVVINCSTYIPFFPMLHLNDRIVGICGGELINTPSVAELIHTGRIAEVGTGTGMARLMNLERLYRLQPDLILSYGTGDPNYDQQDKLMEAGFHVAIDGDYMETTPLGRTEWMKFIAAFFDKDVEAERQFAGIAHRYEAEVARTRTVSSRPTVFCDMDYQGTWLMPGGGSYIATYLQDAGADYLWHDDHTTGSMPLDIEAVIARAKNANLWLDPGECRSLAELIGMDARYAIFRAVRTGRVYNNNAKMGAGGGNDYWETGVAHPDQVLADLISIMHPELEPHHQRIWYQQLPARVKG